MYPYIRPLHKSPLRNGEIDDKKALAGRKVLTAHLEDGACGWFVGSVFTSSVGALVQEGEEGVPTATHVVEYKEKETRTKALVGKVAIEFSPENYGPGDGTAGSGGCSLSHALSPPQQPEAAEE